MDLDKYNEIAISSAINTKLNIAYACKYQKFLQVNKLCDIFF